MKKILMPVYLMLTLLTNSCGYGQISQHPWIATIKVVDEDGQPIVGADVAISYDIFPSSGQSGKGVSWDEIKGLTDTNGIFKASHMDNSWNLGIAVEKQKYYATHTGHQLYIPGQFDEKIVAASRDFILAVTLKKIGRPVAMYAKKVDAEPLIFKKTGHPPIAFTNSIGYDLMIGDWVSPYGKGANTDIIFTEAFDKKSILDFYYKLTIRFPNIGDGIQEFSVPDMEKGSALRSPHEALLDGYQAQLTRENYHHSGQVGKADYDPERNYFFRVRTMLDSNGKVKSALYGKIYGDPEQMNFSYFLNATPNDRNIEFDPKQNLLGGLKSFEQVTAP